jgi:hypothetical protein
MKYLGRCTAILVVLTIGRAGRAADNACPSADDIPYSTQKGETLYSLGNRAYCLDGQGDRSRAALALYEYNRGRVGPNVNDLPEGVTICLPKFLHGSFFNAERCRSAPVAMTQSPEAPAPVKPNPVCGNGRREEGEVCDGSDLGGISCASFHLRSGNLTCRSDCSGFDANTCAVDPPQPPAEFEQPPEPPKRPDEPAKPIRVEVDIDAATGVLFPLSSPGTASIYGTLGLVRVGARVHLGRVELVPHGLVGGGGGTTLLDGHDADLAVICAGGGLQAGIPVFLGQSLRLTPGIEAQRLWMQRTVDARVPYGPVHLEKQGGTSLLGIFLRPEIRFARYPRLVASLEFALGFVPGETKDFTTGQQFQMKTLAGVTYNAF